jgi:hypothetical protein
MIRSDITTLDIIRNILLAEITINGLRLDEKRVNIFNQLFSLPNDEGLFITIGSTDIRPKSLTSEAKEVISVKTVTINAAGSGYAKNDTIRLKQGTSIDCVLTVTSVNGSGGITGVSITVSGAGYSVASAIETEAVHSSGVGCLINITAVDTSFLETIKLQCVTEPVYIRLTSRNEDAYRAIFDVIAAMASKYSQQVQEKTGVKIGRVPCDSVKNGSYVDGSARIFQFDITYNVLTAYSFTKEIDYYDTFLTKLYVGQGDNVEERDINVTEEA